MKGPYKGQSDSLETYHETLDRAQKRNAELAEISKKPKSQEYFNNFSDAVERYNKSLDSRNLKKKEFEGVPLRDLNPGKNPFATAFKEELNTVNKQKEENKAQTDTLKVPKSNINPKASINPNLNLTREQKEEIVNDAVFGNGVLDLRQMEDMKKTVETFLNMTTVPSADPNNINKEVKKLEKKQKDKSDGQMDQQM